MTIQVIQKKHFCTISQRESNYWGRKLFSANSRQKNGPSRQQRCPYQAKYDKKILLAMNLIQQQQARMCCQSKICQQYVLTIFLFRVLTGPYSCFSHCLPWSDDNVIILFQYHYILDWTSKVTGQSSAQGNWRPVEQCLFSISLPIDRQPSPKIFI